MPNPLTYSIGDDVLYRGTGNGGMTSSLLQPPSSPAAQRPRSASLQPRRIAPSSLRRLYDRSELPIRVEHTKGQLQIKWAVSADRIDLHRYLPVFFDGLREKEDPYRFFAVQGICDLVQANGHRLSSVIPSLVAPIKGKFT